MKKTLVIVSAFMLMTLIDSNLNAALVISNPVTTTTPTTTASEAEQSAIIARVYEIKNMDKSKLTSAEKKGLRTELRSLKKRYREGGGIYLSVGAIIVIILLLILILR